MLKKSLQLGIVLLFIGSGAFAQQWNGNNNTTDVISREGNVGIGTSTPAAKLEVNMFNPNGTPQSGLLLKTNSFFTWPNAESSYFIKAEELGNTNATFVLNGKGYLGMGNATPIYPLTLETTETVMASFKHNGVGNSSVRIGNNNGYMNLGVGATTVHPYIWSSTNGFIIGNDGDPTVFVNGMGNGSVGIGTVSTGSFKLAVEGKIGAREVQVTLSNPFPDYVFDSKYKLRSLSSLENYINENKHLPNIPSAAEVEKNGGVELGKLNTKLLEKVEELTLYIIEINKKVEKLEKENEALKKGK